MLSVAESAQILRVSPTRIRQLISQGSLPAHKVGRSWALREEDVMQRASDRPKSGRPRSSKSDVSNTKNSPQQKATMNMKRAIQPSLAEIYDTCRKTFASSPSATEISTIDDPEQAAFRIAIADFFLQRKQQELIKQGVY